MKIGELTLNQVKEMCKDSKICYYCKLKIDPEDRDGTCCLLHHKWPEEWNDKYLEKEIRA